ncbi:MAG: winged helix-turn-helix domain-containing protein [Thermomicrobiales bacterium]
MRSRTGGCAALTSRWTPNGTRWCGPARSCTSRRPSTTCCTSCWSTPGASCSRAQILDRVWSYDYDGDPAVVDTYISYLRRKIDHVSPKLIHTVRGIGFTLRVDE